MKQIFATLALIVAGGLTIGTAARAADRQIAVGIVPFDVAGVEAASPPT